VDARRQLNELITAASLPPVESTRELAGGFDNQLLVGVLRDGRSWDTGLKLWIDRLEEHLTMTWTPAPVTQG
jgi:hypothetical protein